MTNVIHQLRDFAFGVAIALLIATVAFIAVRNEELVDRQIELATRAAHAIASGRSMPDVRAAVLGPSVPSPKRPFLRQRHVRDPQGAWRPLGATGGPDDKLMYDAANRFDRHRAFIVPTVGSEPAPGRDEAVSRPWGGPITSGFAELLPDGSGRAIALAPIRSSRDYLLAIAITPPAAPAPYPFLVIIGLLGLGAALSAAGALVSAPDGRLARAGTAVGVGVLAIPCVLWQSWIAATAIGLVSLGLALAQRARWTDRLASGVRGHRTALGFLAPAAISMLVLVAAPFVIGLVIGFYDHHQGTWSFVGLSNFVEILSGGGRSLDDPLNFWFIFGVTVLWTVANILASVTIGVALALLLSKTWLGGRGIYRMLFILPWAIPNYITALIFKGMFDGEYSAINSLFDGAGLERVSWFTTWAASFSANVVTNVWLGFPFIMVVALGAIETIPKDLYEAAAVDGANSWQRFRHITLPHLRPALAPAIALSSIWTFNQFNVIYLVSAGAPGGSTNILVTDAYRWAFERGERYGMAAAYATIIFAILLLWTVFGTRTIRGQKDA